MRPKIQSYEDLEVWQMAMTLAEQCYLLTSISLARRPSGCLRRSGAQQFQFPPTLPKDMAGTKPVTS